MRVLGVDFSSRPGTGKPITLCTAEARGPWLRVERLERLTDLAAFDAALRRPGPWVMGLDLPLCFARPFIERIGWPRGWGALADHLAALPAQEFAAALVAFRTAQPPGQKHLPRAVDRLTGGAAPNNIVNPPVGKMLFQAVPRLRAAGVMLPGLAPGDPARRVVEAYPAALARRLIGTTSYKSGNRQDPALMLARRRQILDLLAEDNPYGLRLELGLDVTSDPAGDDLDAVLCAVQAGWAQRAGLTGPAGPGPRADPVEGWIADPAAFDPPLDLSAVPGPFGPDTP